MPAHCPAPRFRPLAGWRRDILDCVTRPPDPPTHPLLIPTLWSAWPSLAGHGRERLLVESVQLSCCETPEWLEREAGCVAGWWREGPLRSPPPCRPHPPTDRTDHAVLRPGLRRSRRRPGICLRGH